MSELGDRREPVGECGETSEKVAKGWGESERFGGKQRHPVWRVYSVGEAEKQRQDIGRIRS